MPNVAQLLKEEMRRIARRERRAECKALRNHVGVLRNTVRAQKDTIAQLQRDVAALGAQKARGASEAEAAGGPAKRIRISSASIKRQRTRLNMSQRELGQLMNVSTNTVVRWEAGSSKPRAAHLENFAKLRELGRRDVRALLEK